MVMTCLFMPSSAHSDVIPVVKLSYGFGSWSAPPAAGEQPARGQWDVPSSLWSLHQWPDPLDLSSASQVCTHRFQIRIHVHTA